MMYKIKCPVEKCKGFETTSSHHNLYNHIKNLAKGELLENFIVGSGQSPHADWLKTHSVRKTKIIFKIGKSFYIPK